MKQAIYLDHAATTPMHPDVLACYIEALQTAGNASSTHLFGREAKKLLENARRTLAQSICALPNEIIFTSGGTEADNLAVFGAAQKMAGKGRHIITTAIEHHAVLNPCKRLESQGYDVTYLQPDEEGRVTSAQVADALTDETILVSVMYGNNEVGTIQPIAEIGALLKDHQALFHTDAVQAYGIAALDTDALGVDLLSVSAHKVNGPKGIGFLYERTKTMIVPQISGGMQEKGRRAGTENIAAAAAFAKAAEIAVQQRHSKAAQYGRCKDAMEKVFTAQQITFIPTVKTAERLAHIYHVSLPGTDVETLLMRLDIEGVAVSSGSACTAGSFEPSHVVSAMYGDHSPNARNSIRISFGLGIDEQTAAEAAQRIAAAVKQLTTN